MSSAYSLVGENSAKAVELGLAEAEWYQTPVPRETMRELLQRRDGPAVRDTVLWFALLFGTAGLTVALWPSWWAAIPYLVYAVIYASTSDSRWHEAGHGTSFKTDWMNNALYEIASFMVMRESVVWRWTHVRHHSDTIIVGRDPEIAVPRPPSVPRIVASFFGLLTYPLYFKAIVRHALGRVSDEERTVIPESEFGRLFARARIYVAIYAAVIVVALATWSILPLLLVGLPNLFGTWLMVVYGMTQHAGLAENVLDHRLNCRTVYMNRLNRYLYWNMNYHVEHHMFPLVPYHALPRLHEAVKHDTPPPYHGLRGAWSEIIPAVLRQVKDPTYHVKRVLPPPRTARGGALAIEARPDAEGWVNVAGVEAIAPLGTLRLDVGHRTFALYRDAGGKLYATDGVCTHGNAHLSNGLVKDKLIECAKHNGRFHLEDGSPARAPVCRGLATYPVEERSGRVFVNVARPGGSGARAQQKLTLRVVSNQHVATFIKELVLEALEPAGPLEFTPGDYIQLDIPVYDAIPLRDLDVPESYRPAWQRLGLFDLVAKSPTPGRRNNYSLACNPKRERTLRFNVRLATPPPGGAMPGVGSTFVFNLKPGDTVTAIGPFGDFHAKPTRREMVYIGGGAGMAPLRAHLSHLFENEATQRKVSFWYGARSKGEVFYQEYFEELARQHPNFTFHVALSSPLAEDRWEGLTGFIHEVVRDGYLKEHRSPGSVEYYLCGPPPMIEACTDVLRGLGVPAQQIAYDAF